MTARAASFVELSTLERTVRRFSLGTAIAALVAAALSGAAAAGERGAEPGSFDYYVLALSWSPSYCVAEGDRANPQQCGSGRPFAFVVHGLWPQYDRGYPEFCRSRLPDRVPDQLVGKVIDIMPSAGLIGHQWRKHGSCSGLGQEDYFSLVRKARERVSIPEPFRTLASPLLASPGGVEAAFMSVNEGLDAGGIAVTCKGRLLREVRICLTRDLEFRACPEVDRKACRADRALMPAAR
ncbi:ribonuclease T2 [Nitratireductor thuwali]|uniref:Ribonuclease n=1 Tax=Nitratireductor thuwali TaxID=2267699 RepID=A0ABY5MNR6_9HYPH|nr:Ribonuclease [Nitratireductor thuwali]